MIEGDTKRVPFTAILYVGERVGYENCKSIDWVARSD
jgi:hypothetical protein